MTDEDEENLKDIFQEIKQYHLENGADESYAELLSLLEVYRIRTAGKKRDPHIVADIRTKLSKVIYDYDFDKNKYEILQSLYRTLETVIGVIENEKANTEKERIIKHHLFIQDGELKDNVTYLEHSEHEN